MSFKVSFDPFSKHYDTQFPIFLHDRGITSDQYTNTLQQASLLVQNLRKPLEKFRRELYIAMAVATALLIVTVLSPIFLPNDDYFIVPFILFFMVAIICIIALIKKLSVTQQNFKEQMIQFLEQENQRLYYAKGVQLLYCNSTSTPTTMQYNHQVDVFDIQIVLAQHPYAPVQVMQPIPSPLMISNAQPVVAPQPIFQPMLQQPVYYSANTSHQL